MSLIFFLKPSYTPPSFGGFVYGDTYRAQQRRARQGRQKERARKERIALRVKYKKLKKQMQAEKDRPVPFVPEIPPFQRIAWDLRGYAEDLMRASILKMRRVRDFWVYYELMFGDDDD